MDYWKRFTDNAELCCTTKHSKHRTVGVDEPCSHSASLLAVLCCPLVQLADVCS
jgi:hypothetical protein